MSDKRKNAPTVRFSKDSDEIDVSKLDLTEEVIQLNRVAKVVKGGRRFSFSALVVVGDKNGHVGLGLGKANEVPESIQKGVQNAKKNILRIPLVGRTIPYQVDGEFSAAKVMLKPAGEGTGIIAGPAVRSVMELGGIGDILTKNLGSKNVINILKAVIEGLKSIRDAEEVMRLRGKTLEEVVGKRRAEALRSASGKGKKDGADQAEDGADGQSDAGPAGEKMVVLTETPAPVEPMPESVPDATPPAAPAPQA